MCDWGTWRQVCVHIDADLSCDGMEKWKHALIDECIADLVSAIQKAGINMRSSCCGHGKGPGRIDLSDGRSLLICFPDDADEVAAELEVRHEAKA